MATITSAGSGLWSATATWVGGVVPVDDDTVVIASGHVVEFNVDTSGFAAGIAGITVTGTLSLTRTAGTYHLKMKAATTIAGAGTLDCGTSVSAIPFAAKHTITGGAAWYIDGTAGLTMTVYAAEPTIKYIRLTVGESAAATVLRVDTDVMGDIWAAGDLIRIDNINKAMDGETQTIDAGGIAAGTITITGGLVRAKIAGTYVSLATRNVRIIGEGTSAMLRSFQTNKLTIGGGEYVHTADYRHFESCVDLSISGGAFYNTGTNAATGVGFFSRDCRLSVSGGVVSGFNDMFWSPIYGGVGTVISGGLFTSSNYVFEGFSGVTITGGIYAGNGAGVFWSSFYFTAVDASFIGNSSVGFSATAFGDIRNCTFSGNNLNAMHATNIIESTFTNNSVGVFGSGNIANCEFTGQSSYDLSGQFTLFNTLLGSATEVSGYTSLPVLSYSESIDHDQVAGAYKAWTRGGITTKQSSVYPTGYTGAMQTVLESATSEGYWQKEQSVGAGQSVNLDLWLRKSASMSYLPRVYVFLKRSADPFAGGTPLKTFTMTDSIDTFEQDTYTYSNDGTEDETLVIRFQGKNASGNLFSALTITVLNVDLTAVLSGLGDIKGTGWTDESLVSIQAHLEEIKGVGWSSEDLVTIKDLLDSIMGIGWTIEDLVTIKTLADTIDTNTTPIEPLVLP